MNLQSSTLKADESGEPLHVQQARQIRAYREAWKAAGHDHEPRVSVSRSILPVTSDRDRAYFGRGGDSDQIGIIDNMRALFGRTYAAEPDVLADQLRADEAIAEADTLLLTVPNQLGVAYNAHLGRQAEGGGRHDRSGGLEVDGGRAGLPYGHTYGLRQLRGETVPMTAEQEATLAALTGEAEELTEDQDRRMGEIEASVDALNDRPVRFDPADVAIAGAFASIDRSGRLQVERGFVRPEDERPVEPEPATLASEEAAASPLPEVGDGGEAGPVAAPVVEPEEEDGLKPLSDRLMSELTAHRTLGLRHALGQRPDVAFLAALHVLTLKAFYTYPSGSCLELDHKSVSFSAQAPGLNDSRAAEAVRGRHDGWVKALPKESADLWDALQDWDGDSRASLFAHVVSLSVNAVEETWNRRPRAVEHAGRLAQAVDLDMVAQGWAPTVDKYLGRVTKARILQAVAEANGQRDADRIQQLKKVEMAETAAALSAGSGCLPEPLRTPGREPKAVEELAANGGETAMLQADASAEDEPFADSPHAIAAE